MAKKTPKKKHAISKRLVQQMERESVNAANLARELGVAEATVHNWREGNTLPNAGLIEQICLFLNCEMSWFISGVSSSSLQISKDQNPAIATLILPVLGEDRSYHYGLLQDVEADHKTLRVHLLKTPEMEPELKRGCVMLVQEIPISQMDDGYLAVVEWDKGAYRVGVYYRLDKSNASLQFTNEKTPELKLRVSTKQKVYRVVQYYLDVIPNSD